MDFVCVHKNAKNEYTCIEIDRNGMAMRINFLIWNKNKINVSIRENEQSCVLLCSGAPVDTRKIS